MLRRHRFDPSFEGPPSPGIARRRLGVTAVAVLGVLAVCASAPSHVSAQTGNRDEDARYHFNLGQVAYNAGRFEDAAKEFEEAYRLSGRTTLLYNIFLARRDAGQLGPAIEALEKFLELEPDSPDAPAFRRRLESMRRLYAEQGGGSEEDDPSGAAASSGADGTDPALEGAGETDPTPTYTDANTSTDDGGGGGISIPGLVLVSAGGAMALTGVITGILALQRESDLEDACGDGACPDNSLQGDIDNGRRLALATDILIPVGLVTAGVGVVLLLLDAGGGGDDEGGTAVDGSEKPAVGLACSTTGCAGNLTLRF